MLRATLLLFAISMTALVSGCPSTLEGAPCASAEQCSGSQVCLDGVCRALSSLPDGAIDHLDASRPSDAAGAMLDASSVENDAASEPGLDAGADRADAPATIDAATTPDAEIPCRTSGDCPSIGAGELFCETSGTSCGEGVCRVRPTRCDPAGRVEDTTVCGCDGQRYASECWRRFFGIGIGLGCSETTPIRCRSEDAGSCAPGSFCELGTDTASPCAPGEGTCVVVPAPSSCDPTPTLVCGCDGRTYTSGCERRAATTSARGSGFCTCDRSADCSAPDTFCDHGLAHSAAACAAATPGVCARVPLGCSVGDVPGDEVATCGSGVVHEDDCLRRADRVESAYAPPECSDGTMPPPGCCFDSTQCAAGEHCYGPATCSAAGRCLALTRPTDCYGDADCGPGRTCAGAVVEACGGRRPTVGTCVVRNDAVFGS